MSAVGTKIIDPTKSASVTKMAEIFLRRAYTAAATTATAITMTAQTYALSAPSQNNTDTR